jgi:hypothetical protein
MNRPEPGRQSQGHTSADGREVKCLIGQAESFIVLVSLRGGIPQ